MFRDELLSAFLDSDHDIYESLFACYGPPFWQEISLMLTESIEPIENKTTESIK